MYWCIFSASILKIFKPENKFFRNFFNPLSANITKWSNIPKQFVGKLPTNCLSVFDHFAVLALKGLSFSCCGFLYIYDLFYIVADVDDDIVLMSLCNIQPILTD